MKPTSRLAQPIPQNSCTFWGDRLEQRSAPGRRLLRQTPRERSERASVAPEVRNTFLDVQVDDKEDAKTTDPSVNRSVG